MEPGTEHPLTRRPTDPILAAELAGCTGLALRRVTRRVTQLYDQALEPAGLTIVQFGLLAHVVLKPELSLRDLAERAMMDPTTLTRLLRPLEQRGLIRMTAAEEDRRRRLLEATPAGRQALQAAVPHWRQAQAALARQLGPELVDRLDGALGAALGSL